MIEIKRKQSGLLHIDDESGVAMEFFTTDVSSAGAGSYDERASSTDPGARFAPEDVEPIRTGMRLGRLDTRTWSWMVEDSPTAYLDTLDPEWDLVEMSLDDWVRVRVEMKTALAEFVGEGRQIAVATKMLHYKRHRLIPILDRLVLEMIGCSVSEYEKGSPDRERQTRERVAETAVQACDWLRAQAELNKSALLLIQKDLAAAGLERSLVRILDALLWSVHPATLASHRGVIKWSRG